MRKLVHSRNREVKSYSENYGTQGLPKHITEISVNEHEWLSEGARDVLPAHCTKSQHQSLRRECQQRIHIRSLIRCGELHRQSYKRTEGIQSRAVRIVQCEKEKHFCTKAGRWYADEVPAARSAHCSLEGTRAAKSIFSFWERDPHGPDAHCMPQRLLTPLKRGTLHSPPSFIASLTSSWSMFRWLPNPDHSIIATFWALEAKYLPELSENLAQTIIRDYACRLSCTRTCWVLCSWHPEGKLLTRKRWAPLDIGVHCSSILFTATESHTRYTHLFLLDLHLLNNVVRHSTLTAPQQAYWF